MPLDTEGKAAGDHAGPPRAHPFRLGARRRSLRERLMAASVRHRWQEHPVYACLMLRIGQPDLPAEIHLRLPAWPGRAVVRGIEPPDGVSPLSGFHRSLPAVADACALRLPPGVG